MGDVVLVVVALVQYIHKLKSDCLSEVSVKFTLTKGKRETKRANE